MLHGDILSLPGQAILNGHETNGHALLPAATPWVQKRAEEWFCREALTAPPADLAEPFTLPWFLALEYHRHHRQARWLAQALEFSRHAGETVLALGYGLGTDWVQYARAGAQVIIGSPDPEELAITRQHFALRGLQASFLHCPKPNLALPPNSVDLACLSQMATSGSEFADWLAVTYRLLKPGGKLLLLHSLPSYSFWEGRRLSRQVLPLLADFEDISVSRHHLRRAELNWFWRWLPRRWLERVFGRFLLVRAHKPILRPNASRLAA